MAVQLSKTLLFAILLASALSNGRALPETVLGTSALREPQQVVSQNGALTFNVVAAQLSGKPQLAYNGSPIPPTLRLKPGDTLYVNLTNRLPQPPGGAGYRNATSLHFHGLQVSPNAPGDDSIDMLALPGQSLHYRIVIPSTHPSGLYWYHSHAHGEAERQNLAGMSGALIVDGISSDVPTVANLPERVLIVRDALPTGQSLPSGNRKQIEAMEWAMRHGTSTPGMSMDAVVRGSTTAQTRNPYVDVDPYYDRFVRPAVDSHCSGGSPEAPSRTWTLNGQVVPSIGILPGQKQFWRLVNAGSDTYLDLSIDGTLMHIVALDGIALARAGNVPLTVNHYLVPPASRIEFFLTGPPAGKALYMRTYCFDSGPTGLAMPAATLAVLDPTSSPNDGTRRRDRAISSRALAGNLRSFLATHAVARTQTLIYSSQDQINGQTFDPAAPPQFYAQSGTLERWQIVNASSQVHTFHIHQTHFLVQSVVGGEQVEQNNVGQVLDNIDVPAASANGPGSVTLIMDFTNPLIVGTFLLHCHILSHEDAGMMSKIRVGTAPPLLTNAPPAGLSFTSPSAATKTLTLEGGAAPYSVHGCTNVAQASVSGANVRVTPVGAGGCVLIASDRSGLTASIAVSVAAVASPVSVAPLALAFASADATSQNATIAGGNGPYGVSGCAGIASASIAARTLTVRPEAVGSCSLQVVDSAKNERDVSVSVNGGANGNGADNLTFHKNNARQGWNSAETVLTTANVKAASFGKLAYLTGSGYGKVYAQPLYATRELVGAVRHNLLIVSTATDRIYAYDDETFAIVWERSFTNAAAGITQQTWSDIACSDVNPDIGIVGTPVIDRALDRMFVVVPTKENGTYHMRLHALSLARGTDAVAPVEVSASVMLAGNAGTAMTNAEHNFNRTALLEANGNIYVGLGSHCDGFSGTTHGWLLAYRASSLAPAGTIINVTNSQNAGYLGVPWMSGFGPAADANGNVYFATGNGPWDGINNFSMSDIKVPGDLDIANGSSFTPYDEASQSASDVDLGSGGLMLLPDGLSSAHPHLMVQGGKSGVKYLLDRDRLGGRQRGDAGALWQRNIAGTFGGPAFFEDESGKAYILYGSATLASYLFDPGSATFSLSKAVNVPGGCLECRNGGSQPIVSSNGTMSGTTIVWALQSPNSGGGKVVLYAFDATSMSTLFAGVAGGWYPGNGVGTIGGMLVSPLVAGGRVYVPTDGGVAVFGLK